MEPAPCQASAWLREPPGAVLQPIPVPGDYRAAGLAVAQTLSPGPSRDGSLTSLSAAGAAQIRSKEFPRPQPASADDPPCLSLSPGRRQGVPCLFVFLPQAGPIGPRVLCVCVHMC